MGPTTALMLILMTFSSNLSGEPIPHYRDSSQVIYPHIVQANYIYTDGHHIVQNSDHPLALSMNPESVGVFALFDKTTDTIYLPLEWDSRKAFDVGTLAHELTHHMQKWSDRVFNCREATEDEAYKVGNTYMRQHGIVDPIIALGATPDKFWNSTHCDGEKRVIPK
jgi:hypothetical protein